MKMKYKVAALAIVVFGLIYVSNADFGSKETIATNIDTKKADNRQDSIVLGANGATNGHDYVDLGLPSGTKWATCNVGATKPTEFGDYFAWGETKQKEHYGWKTYMWCTADAEEEYNIFKYAESINKYTPADKKKVLEEKDDAAVANWGNAWRMPTNKEIEELVIGCDWRWVADFNGTGISGEVGTSKTNGSTIFLPAAGFYRDDHHGLSNSYGNYWTSEIHEDQSFAACFLSFNDNNSFENLFNERYYGRSVRAVLK